MTDQVTMHDVAARLRVSPATVRSYLHRGQMPTPTGRVMRSPWWSPEAIEPWLAARGDADQIDAEMEAETRESGERA